jgi:hypothetical protein
MVFNCLCFSSLVAVLMCAAPGGVHYGPAGMGGVVNIITRQADSTGVQESAVAELHDCGFFVEKGCLFRSQLK